MLYTKGIFYGYFRMVMLPFSPHRSSKREFGYPGFCFVQTTKHGWTFNGKAGFWHVWSEENSRGCRPSPLVIEKSEKTIPEISKVYIPDHLEKIYFRKGSGLYRQNGRENWSSCLKVKLPGVELSVHDRALNGKIRIQISDLFQKTRDN